ncbi:MAG: glycosyltransferase family 2 protein, partial [Caldimicrobium sp.]
YIWQPNQHKKVAFNRGVKEARGKYFVPIDSDDELLPETLENFLYMWNTIPPEKQDQYAWVMGLYLDDDGKVVGDPFPKEPLDTSFIDYVFHYKIRGDKFACFKTEVLKKFPFPEDIPNLVPESVVWFRMGKSYIGRCFNIPLGINHQDVESICRPKDKALAKLQNAEGRLLLYSETLDLINLKRFLNAPLLCIFYAIAYNVWKLYVIPERRRFKPKSLFGRFLANITKPLGYLVFIMDKKGFVNKLRKYLKIKLW